MNFQDILSRPRSFTPGVSRRDWLRKASVTGTGLVLASGSWMPARADEDDGQREADGQPECGPPLPIPHLTTPPGTHFFFPGPVTGEVVPTDGTGAHPGGRDPSTIYNFEGFIGQVDLKFSGTGTNTKTGESGTFNFHTDMRFMKGMFVGADEQKHRGAFAFI